MKARFTLLKRKVLGRPDINAVHWFELKHLRKIYAEPANHVKRAKSKVSFLSNA
jgi:hypothetical protein